MMITSARLLAAITTSLLILACGGAKNEPAAPKPASASTDGMCPMEAPGAQVSAADTADGVAMVFTTTGDVAQLRQRVHHMAEMHGHMMSGGMMMGSGGMMGSGEMGSGGMMKMVPSTARAEDIEAGARIVLTPNDPAQLSELRAHVHEHATMMASGHCPMMKHHG